MGVINGIVTFIALVLFIAIIWWAFSRGRSKANNEASLLPFALPDEVDEVDEQAQTDGEKHVDEKKQGESHE